jgi:hypothetical protein
MGHATESKAFGSHVLGASALAVSAFFTGFQRKTGESQER